LQGGQVHLAIDAPNYIKILRGELKGVDDGKEA
jgi:sRNA-binding carbon storage regulator CsrA